MRRRELVQRREAELPSLVDAQSLLDAILANGKARLFLVRLDPRGGFSYLPLSGREDGAGIDLAKPGLPVEVALGVEAARFAAPHFRACIAGKAPVSYEERASRSDERWWQTTLLPIRDGRGSVTQLLGISFDITERKSVERTLTATKRQFETIAANLPGVVYQRVRHPDGRVSYPYVSEGAKRLFGHDAEKLQSDSALMLGLIHPDDRPLFDRAIAKSMRDLGPFEMEVRNVVASGEVIWVRSVAQTTKLADGSIQWNGLILDITDRRRAEAQVLEREVRLRDFAEAASDWLWETDAELRFTHISDRFFEIFGIPGAMFLGKRRDEVADTSDEPEKWREHFRTLAERRPFRDFTYCWRVNGQPAGWVKVSGRPVFDETGAFRGYRGTGTDLTAQRQAEEQAAAASRQLLDAVEGLSEGVAIFDAEDKLVLCNARYSEINSAISDILVPGVSFEVVLRKGIERGLHPAAIGSEEEWLLERLADHRAGNSHFERQGSDGHWLQVLEQRTPGGGTTILATDITEVKRRELALSMLAAAGQDGADFFADAVESLAAGLGYRCAGIGWLDRGRTRVRPLAFCEAGLLTAGEAFDIAGTPCETVLEEGGFWAVDREVTQHYPQDTLLRAHAAQSYVGDLVCDAAGQPIAIVFGFDDRPDPNSVKRRDITGLIAARIGLELQGREAEKQLREAKEAAEAASRAKTDFLANMSHELRTPLNAIIGFSQIIADEALGAAGRPEYKDYARDIHSSSQHLLKIINDILDMSRIEAGVLSLREAEVDIAAVLRSCQGLLAAKATAAEIALVRDVPHELPVILADERMVRQIVLNLLANALKFTPRGGTVTLGARAEADRGVVIAISDTGIGIAREDFAKIFRPFGQLDSALNRRFEGTGLGLPLSKGLVELHGGTISLDSEIGRGTTVSVFLPLGRDGSASSLGDVPAKRRLG
ncbi:MAG TPA: ATP-binding protein [Stellaceae bacterium]|nr:ATP-binding protein [Stellaceae bacterium]